MQTELSEATIDEYLDGERRNSGDVPVLSSYHKMDRYSLSVPASCRKSNGLTQALMKLNTTMLLRKA
jgi:hypothetical protein